MSFLLLSFPLPSHAIDGRYDIRDTRQEGRSGLDEYTTRTLQQEGFANHRIYLSRDWLLLMDLQARKEDIESDFGGIDSNWDRFTRQANGILQYGHNGLTGQLHGGGFRRDTTPSVGRDETFERTELGALFNYRGEAPWVGRGSFLETRAWRDESALGVVESRERLYSLDLETARWEHGHLRYGFTRISQTNFDQRIDTVNNSHNLRYEGHREFQEGRGRLSVEARTQYFQQRVTRQFESANELLSLPLRGGVRVDTTPEVEDLLEGGVRLEEGLYDRDRDAPTSIDLGDGASIGQEFGGDYRNIQYDFGQVETLTRAILYVDRILLFPELLQWDLYLSSDPEGRIWEPLAPDVYTVVYREWSVSLQGWQVILDVPVDARWFKLVNRKLGPVGDELLVTELEVYIQAPDEERSSEEHTWDHRLDSSVEYALSDELRAGYDLLLRRRSFSATDRDLQESAHGIWSRWRRRGWFASGRFSLQRIGSDASADTRAKQWQLSTGRDWDRDASVTLSYNRLDDDSRGVDKTLDALSLLGKWRPAPRLQMSQRVSHSWLDDRSLALDSKAFTLSSLLYSTPWPWLTVDFTRTDRWVDDAASVGFTRFNDTSLSVTLIPLPLVSILSTVRYQVREDEDTKDWLVRNSASWSPIHGGSLSLRLVATHLRDTRIDSSLLSGGAQVVWKARRFLTLEGSVESQEYTQEGIENSPLNTVLRGTWTF